VNPQVKALKKTGKPTEKVALGRVARSSVMWGYLRSMTVGLIGFPTAMILARLLEPSDFGIAAAAMFFGQLAARLSSGGMGSALSRVKELRNEHISTVFVINFGFCVLVGLVLMAAAPFIGRFYGTPEVGWVMPLVALNFAVSAFSMIQQTQLSRDLRYKELATIGALDVGTAAVTSVIFAALGFRFWGLVASDICGGIARMLWGVRLVGWHARFRFSPAVVRELGSFAIGSYAKRTLESLTRNVDNMVVGKMLGMTALGFYDKAFSSVSKLYGSITSVGPNVSFRVFAMIQDDPDRFRRAYRKVVMTSTLMTYPMFGVIAATAPHLVPVAFGPKWGATVVPLQLLCVSFALKTMNHYATTASQARGWVWPQVWRMMAQVLCVVVGVYLATPWGINGASIAVVGATLVMCFLTQGMMRAATGLGWADILEPQLASVSLTLALGLPIWGVDLLLPDTVPHLLVLVAQLAVGGVIAALFAWLCPFADIRELLHEVVSDVSPRVAAFVWRDVEAERVEARARRRAERAAALTPGIDAETPAAS
jgi:PST family polysaccharide transporter